MDRLAELTVSRHLLDCRGIPSRTCYVQVLGVICDVLLMCLEGPARSHP